MKLDDRTLMLIALAGAAAAVYFFVIRPAGAAVGAVAQAGRGINDAIIPGEDSLGTWLYGLFNKDPDVTSTPTRPDSSSAGSGRSSGGASGSWGTPGYDYGYGAGSGPLRPQVQAPVEGDPFRFFGL